MIGAGPAGATAAAEIGRAGYSVALLEKHERPGQPLCCAEAVSRASFEKQVGLKSEWISAYIDRAMLVAPDGNSVTAVYPDGGLILNREKLDYDLAQQAVDSGADLFCRTIGLSLGKSKDHFQFLDALQPGEKKIRLEARIFIAADGVESKIGRLAGIENLVELNEVESLLQYRLENISIDPATVEFHVGKKIAPGGYVWVFPKSKNRANVGIGIVNENNRGEPLKQLLDDFIIRRFPENKIIGQTCGMTPKYQGRRNFGKDNLLIVGDAARVLDSFSGAGIINAIISGRYAGQAAIEYLAGRVDYGRQLEALYPGHFLAELEDDLKLYKKLRRVYIHLDDDDFADIVKAARQYFDRHGTGGVRVGKLLTGLIKTRPRLLRLMRYLV